MIQLPAMNTTPLVKSYLHNNLSSMIKICEPELVANKNIALYTVIQLRFTRLTIFKITPTVPIKISVTKRGCVLTRMLHWTKRLAITETERQ